MKRFMVLLFLSALALSGLKAQGAYNIEIKSLDGIPTTLADEIRGELVVLDFWTTWCKPCIRSIPKLIELSEKYDDSKVQFIGVNEDSPRNVNKVKPMVKSLKIPYQVVLDTDQLLLSDLNVNAFPTLIVMDKEANVLYIHVGFSPGDEVELEAKINALLRK